MACKFTCIQPCCYFFIVRTHVTELERSGNEVALRTRYIGRMPETGCMRSMRRFTAHCWSEAETKSHCERFLIYSIFSKSFLSHSISLSVYVDSVISCILFSTKCKSGLTGQEFCGKTHGVGEEGAYVQSTYLGCARQYTTER